TRWLTADQATRLILDRELDPQDVVRAHLDAIDRFDGRIHAYIHVDRGATTTIGITLAVKDSQPVKGMPYTYATPSRRDRAAEEDAVAGARARAAGVGVLGKTNLPERAGASAPRNTLCPPSHNPWRQGVTRGGPRGG